jgi:retron-type reverse transcriptase
MLQNLDFAAVWFSAKLLSAQAIEVPCIKDRVAQMATVIVLAPIFAADPPEEQYGYRRERSAHDEIRTIHGLLNQGHRNVVDCDLSGYFDSIPHHVLMKSMARPASGTEPCWCSSKHGCKHRWKETANDAAKS